MEPVFVLFAATGFLFWALLVLASICMIAALEYERPTWATFSLVVCAVFLWYFTDFSHRYAYLYLTWGLIWKVGLAYLGGGILYSYLKWYLLLSERLERWREAAREYKDRYALPKTEKLDLGEKRLLEFLQNNGFTEFVTRLGYSEWTIKVKPKPNKTRITTWMVYWPWLLVWSLLDDFITGFFRWAYRQLIWSYEAMADYMFQGIEG